MLDLSQALEAECQRLVDECGAASVGILDDRGDLVVEVAHDEYFAVSTQLDILLSMVAMSGGLRDLFETGEFAHTEHGSDRPCFYLAAVARRLVVAIVFEERADLPIMRNAARASADRIAMLITPTPSSGPN